MDSKLGFVRRTSDSLKLPHLSRNCDDIAVKGHLRIKTNSLALDGG